MLGRQRLLHVWWLKGNDRNLGSTWVTDEALASSPGQPWPLTTSRKAGLHSRQSPTVQSEYGINSRRTPQLPGAFFCMCGHLACFCCTSKGRGTCVSPALTLRRVTQHQQIVRQSKLRATHNLQAPFRVGRHQCTRPHVAVNPLQRVSSMRHPAPGKLQCVFDVTINAAWVARYFALAARIARRIGLASSSHRAGAVIQHPARPLQRQRHLCHASLHHQTVGQHLRVRRVPTCLAMLNEELQ